MCISFLGKCMHVYTYFRSNVGSLAWSIIPNLSRSLGWDSCTSWQMREFCLLQLVKLPVHGSCMHGSQLIHSLGAYESELRDISCGVFLCVVVPTV